MDPLAWPRTKAYLLDWLYYLGIAALLVPFGLVALRLGWGANRAYDVLMSLIPPVCAALLAARWESQPIPATPGKKWQGLAVTRREPGSSRPRGGGVVDPGGAEEQRDLSPVTFRRALARNLVKIALPWQLGHLQGLAAAWGAFANPGPATVVLSAVTWPVLVLVVVLVWRPSGLGLHDRVAGTRVLPAR